MYRAFVGCFNTNCVQITRDATVLFVLCHVCVYFVLLYGIIRQMQHFCCSLKSILCYSNT